MSVNGQLQDAAVRHALLLEGFKSGEQRRIMELLAKDVFPDLERTVRSRLNRIAIHGFDPGPWRTKRYKDMLSAVDSILGKGFKNVGKVSRRNMLDLAISEERWQRAALRDALPLDIAYRVPDPATLRAVVSAKPFQGKILRDWWKTVDLNARSVIKQQISIGMVTGESIDQITRRLVGKASDAFSGAFGTVRRNARATVRTSVNHISAAAREQTFAANQDVVKAVRYLATLDARTTDICASLDGREFKPTRGPRPPMHFQCRSTIVPITKSFKELLKGNKKFARRFKDTPKSVRASINGEVPAKLTYGPWLKAQPKAIQNFALGPGKAKLFRRGNVDIRQFVDRNFQSLTLQQLESLESKILSTRGGTKPAIPRKKKVAKKVTKKESSVTPAAPAATEKTVELTSEEIRLQVIALSDDIGNSPAFFDSLRADINAMEDLIRNFDIAKKGKTIGPKLQMERRNLQIQLQRLYKRYDTLSKDSLAIGWDNVNLALDDFFALPHSTRTANPILKARLEKEKRRILDAINRAGRAPSDPTFITAGSEERRQLLKLLRSKDPAKIRLEIAKDPVRSAKNITAWEQQEINRVKKRIARLKWSLGDEGLEEWGPGIVNKWSQKWKTELAKLERKLKGQIHDAELPFIEGRKGYFGAQSTRGTLDANLREAEEWLSQVVSKNSVGKKQLNVPIGRTSDGRAYARSGLDKGTLDANRGIFLAKNSPIRTIIHEYAHHIEFGKFTKRAREFLLKRAKADPKGRQQMKKLFPNYNYKASEYAWEDDFLSTYMGKDYGDRATEIISMGIEQMFANPAALARGDPEYFRFIMDILKGI